MHGVYRVRPCGWIELPGGPVPVFSDQDRYIENYLRISREHVSHMERTGENPFIPGDLWSESEQLTAQLIRAHCRPGSRILDVGCGLGRLFEKFDDCDRYGMDISPIYLEHAQRKGIDVCLSRVEDMPYLDGLFDVVVCTDVLEHVFDVHTACEQILRVTRPGGILAVRVPYREDLSQYRGPSVPYDYVHLRNFDEDGLALMFEKVHECRVIEVRKGPYLARYGMPKCRIPLPGARRAFRAFAHLIRIFGRSTQHRFLEWAFDPTEINVIVEVPAGGGRH